MVEQITSSLFAYVKVPVPAGPFVQSRFSNISPASVTEAYFSLLPYFNLYQRGARKLSMLSLVWFQSKLSKIFPDRWLVTNITKNNTVANIFICGSNEGICTWPRISGAMFQAAHADWPKSLLWHLRDMTKAGNFQMLALTSLSIPFIYSIFWQSQLEAILLGASMEVFGEARPKIGFFFPKVTWIIGILNDRCSILISDGGFFLMTLIIINGRSNLTSGVLI